MSLNERIGLSQPRIVNLLAALFALSLLSLQPLFPVQALDCENFQFEQQQGYVAFVNGNMIEAEKHLTLLLKSCPDRGDVRLQRGLANLELGKYALALDDYIKGFATSSLAQVKQSSYC